MSNLENLIISSLFFEEKFTRRVIPHLKGEYFEDVNNKILFEEISPFVDGNPFEKKNLSSFIPHGN